MPFPDALAEILRATGYMTGNQPVSGMDLEPSTREGHFRPDAIYRDRTHLEIAFKFSSESPAREEVAAWHRSAWNSGRMPIFWVVSPQSIEIYNAFQRPTSENSATKHLLRRLSGPELTDIRTLASLDSYVGRLSMDSGTFWSQESRINHKGRVDSHLLRDLLNLEKQLVDIGLPCTATRGLIGRFLLVRYLSDRGIVEPKTIRNVSANNDRRDMRWSQEAFFQFQWIESAFSDELFPIPQAELHLIDERHLEIASDLLSAGNAAGRRNSLWEYRFDIIPIEFISSIYEHLIARIKDQPSRFTPVPLADLVLDETMHDISPNCRVLDITCGSGVFLIGALRRLVHRKENPVTRQMILDTTRCQIFGVDKSEAAIRATAFSLHLAAFDLDPVSHMMRRHPPLIGQNLFVADALDAANLKFRLAGKKFDLVVGNPPWLLKDRTHFPQNSDDDFDLPLRNLDFRILWKTMQFTHPKTRFGIVMRANPFFSREKKNVESRNRLIEHIRPVTIVNLSELRNKILPNVKISAIILLARAEHGGFEDRVRVVTVPWTEKFRKSGWLDIGSCDVKTGSWPEILEAPQILKTIAVGTARDRLLLDRLKRTTIPLKSILDTVRLGELQGTGVAADDGSASFLRLPISFSAVEKHVYLDQAPYSGTTNHREPPSGSARPLVLIGKRLYDARLQVFFYNETRHDEFASQKKFSQKRKRDLSLVVGAILASSMASWYFLMTSSAFGVGKRKITSIDLLEMPVPSAESLISAETGIAPSRAKSFNRHDGYSQADLKKLDDDIFEIYSLRYQERLVVQDALERTKDGRLRSENSITIKPYAKEFLRVINDWQIALDRSPYDAEIVAFGPNFPYWAISFLQNGSGRVQHRQLEEENLNKTLGKIGTDTGFCIADHLRAARELRVHTENGIVVVKPSCWRYWTRTAALNDADSALGDGLK